MFKKYLYQNNIVISISVLNQLTSNIIKTKCNKLYFNLKNIGIEILPIVSLNIPQCINYFNNLPVALVVFGNKAILSKNSKKIVNYYTESFSINGKYNYNYFINQISNIDYINICFNRRMRITSKENIVVLQNLNEFKEISKMYNKSDLYIFTNNAIDIISLLSDILFIVEAKYEENIVKLVDNMLDCGKEILVVPSNIGYHSYFSNYLIKEGANVILNKKDLIEYLLD